MWPVERNGKGWGLMSELVVLAFEKEQDAYGLRGALRMMKDQHLVELEDAPIVVHEQDGSVEIDQSYGTIAGRLVARFKDIGVDDGFIKEIGHTIEPGHSALFLLAKDQLSDEALEMIETSNATLLRSTMSAERVKEFFGGGETA